MSKKGVFKVYFDNDGDMLDRVYSWQKPSDYKEEDNHVFTDKMEYSGYGGSHIYFKSLVSGRRYQMFISDFDKMMKKKLLVANVIEGEFTFTKKGAVQGFKMILDSKP